MLQRIYLIVEEGADRVYVQTTYPAWYQKPADRGARIFAVDAPLDGVDVVDGLVRLSPARVYAVEPPSVYGGNAGGGQTLTPTLEANVCGAGGGGGGGRKAGVELDDILGNPAVR